MAYKAGDKIPGLCKVPREVYEVQEGVCSSCGDVGYVLAGLELNLQHDDELAFFQKYQRQKPLKCQVPDCGRVFCQACVAQSEGRCPDCRGRLEFL